MITVESGYTVPAGVKALPFKCSDCGTTLAIVMPVEPGMLSVIIQAMEDRHAECLLDKKENG